MTETKEDSKKQSPLKEKTQHKILHAAIVEFADKGYVNASTNAIVARAGVSKGLVFHYFKNKMTLFKACIDHCFLFFETYVDMTEIYTKTDLFDRIQMLIQMKANLYRDHRDIYMAVAALYFVPLSDDLTEESAGARSLLAEINRRYQQDLLSGLDLSLLTPGCDAQKAIDYILISVQMHEARIMARYRNNMSQFFLDIPKLLEEWSEIMRFLKYGVYSPSATAAGKQ